jgi:hypothetical protein
LAGWRPRLRFPLKSIEESIPNVVYLIFPEREFRNLSKEDTTMNESIRKKIEQRAYEFFLQRGGKHGYHVEDWAKAEKEIMAELDKNQGSTGKPHEQVSKPAPVAKPAKKPQQAKRK